MASESNLAELTRNGILRKAKVRIRQLNISLEVWRRVGSSSHRGCISVIAIKKWGIRMSKCPEVNGRSIPSSFQTCSSYHDRMTQTASMARISPVSVALPTNTADVSATELGVLLSRLEHSVLQADSKYERRLRADEFERTKLESVSCAGPPGSCLH